NVRIVVERFDGYWGPEQHIDRIVWRIIPDAFTRKAEFLSGVIGGTTVSGDLLPLLAEAAKRKQILRVAIERDFESLRPDIGAGDTFNMLRRLIYTTPILWGTKQRPDGSLIYDTDTIEMVLATAYKVSEDRQMIEFTLRHNARFANGDPLNAQALKDSYA